jgi:probable HAF family extracellular repeat protein
MLQLPAGGEFGAFALSSDGSAMAVNTGTLLFRWTPTTGFVGLSAGDPNSSSIGISPDGNYIAAARLNADGTFGPQRWDNQAGWIELGHPSDGCALGEGSESTWGSAYGVSANGGVVVGLAWTCDSHAEGFAWTPGGGMVSLGRPAANRSSRASAVSADGSTIVGFSEDPSGGFRRASSWTNGVVKLIAGQNTPGEAAAVSSNGSQIVGQFSPRKWPFGSALDYTNGKDDALGTLSRHRGDSSYANGVSDDGTIVGWSGASFGGVQRAFIANKSWSGGPGMHSLKHILVARGAKIPANIILSDALAISADGSTVVGTWVDASFHQGSFLAHLR